MKLTVLILVILTLVGFMPIGNDFVTEKIVFKKKQVGVKRTFHIDRPILKNQNVTTLQILGGHGYGFQLLYSNTAAIYYSNDRFVSTPNYENYNTIGWKGFNRLEEIKDTLIEGQQLDGLFWMEIKKGNEFVGYFNVLPKDKVLFERSIKSLRKYENPNT